MYLQPDDLEQVIYGYQIDQITEGNNDLVLQALAAAEQETRGYLAPNLNNRDSFDGRPLYDVATIFNATGSDRDAIIVQHAVTIAKFHLVHLCNADILFDRAQSNYDRATAWLVRVAKGEVILDSLPTVTINDESTTPTWSYGSRKKFNHGI
ncbi:hypothetical protein GCM10007424_23680 [Flavobacterium suaedae]|uniref:DUF1320 domain-containing protein n=1 Tax=Flavobacterium suaedae TaxID=1767027 RepID=A0ABQ1JZ27_9FLAO|nr:phage protein Gp36 family protein [Flavobacterium suaedae]GGB82918.1 hypothetical protein GCM10007424_23680 [Flavobacterium suaedae]